MNVKDEEARQFIAANHRAVVATIRSDGMAQMSNVAQAYLDERIEISTRAPSAKVKNLRRDPRVTILVLGDETWYQYVVVYGKAEVIELPEAGPELRRIYETIAGPHPDWKEYDAAMVAEQRVVIRISIDRILS
ncbi:MAG TPA: PPOX class F420-dependent oxidoreductase [Chloroflexota bacterium]|jgi:PPOX class probable F420-dependent enzyme|nr:PPOX class F420-dependent oxidoreductase [Chloroflexota bacterium]